MTKRNEPTAAPAHERERWPVDRVKPYARNARKHPAKQVKQLARSIKRFGQVWPLLVREDGTLIAGHGRFEAMLSLDFAEVEVIVARGWSEEQCREFGLIDNKLAENSEWNDDLLRIEVRELFGAGIKLDAFGFDKSLRLDDDAEEDGGDDAGDDAKFESKFQILIECESEQDQLDKLKQFTEDGLKCRALLS